MSPYIVTTKRECDQPACGRVEPCAAERSGWCAHPHSEDGFGNRTPISRRVVATLDEARTEAGKAVNRAEPFGGAPYGVWAGFRDDVAHRLPESGGTVGPLPDGTLIEVERA